MVIGICLVEVLQSTAPHIVRCVIGEGALHLLTGYHLDHRGEPGKSCYNREALWAVVIFKIGLNNIWLELPRLIFGFSVVFALQTFLLHYR